MTHRLLRNIAALLVLVFFVECLPTAFLGEQIFLLHSNAEAEAVKQQGDKVADEQAATFSAIADVARSRMLTDQISNDGEWQYLVLPEYGYAVITGHTDQGTQAVTVPDVLGGADVVAMLENVFAGHSRLCDVTFSTNLYAVAEGALPRGVTVNGYHGSYAQRWATQYGHPFANLSALDFVAGVIDCSDMDSSHFVRKSSTEVTMRSLEASRLQVGSVFFLPDPDDLYAVAYYRVAVRENAENDMVTFTCVTPGASEVVNSFTFDNAPLMPDWDTFQLADGVDTTVDEVRRLSASESNTVSFPYLNFEKKIGDYKITAGVTPSYTYKLSGEYSHFELQEASITETNSTKFYFKVSEKQAAYSYDEENEEKPSDIVKKMIKEARENKEKLKEKVETSQKLSTVVLFSWWGLVSVTFDISLNIEFSGSFEVNYTASTVTKYTYHDGTLSSSSTSSKKSITGSMKAEIKAGLFISLNLYVLNAEVFGFGAFVGLKTSASMKWETVLSEHKTTEDAITKALSEKTSDADITGNWMNMLDCISIKINFVLEVEAKLFKKPIWSKSILDLEIAHWHWHFSPFYYTDYPISVKVKEDISKAFHDEDNCPYTDAVYLLLPELDKRDTRSAAFKSITLGAQGNAVDLPVLDLPSYGKRVTYWYRDYALTDKYMIGEAGHVRYTTKAGEKFYGKTEDIGTIKLVDGRLNVLLTDPSVKTENVSFGTETTVSEQAAWRCVESGNTLNTKSLKLARESHIIGWREAIPVTVSAPFPSTVPDLFPKYGDLIPHDKTNGTIFTSNGKKNQTYVAICDDDFTITFISPKGETSTITKGFMEEVQADEVPQFAYDPALWEIRWITESDSDVSFPITVTKDITLRASKRYIGTDHADTVIGVYPSTGIPSPVSDILLFNYSANEDGIVITGLSALGSVQTSLSIPAQVNGMPVVSVKAGAFKGNTNLIYVRLPATVKTIGSSAFEGCTALQVLDLAACSSLSSIPSRFAYGDTALRYVSIANGMTEIEDYAFYGCTSLSGKAVINASVGYGAFYNCKGMTELELHYMCEYVDSSAFSGCTALNETSIPESVMRIGSSAFKDCSVLISVEVPSSVTSIGGNAFSGCDNLESITLPFIGTSEGSIDRAFRKIFNNGENDGSSQYYGKGVPKKLKTVTITSATSIPDHAFAGCENIETIRINDGDMDIEDLAFYNCTSLKNLTLPTRTTKIGIEAFAGCVSLEEVSISKNVLEIGQYAFSGCSRLKEIRLPNGLLTIGSVAFKNCSALTSVEVPSSVTSIGGSAFSGCDNLEFITLPFIGTSEGSIDRAFRKIFNNGENDGSSQYYGKGVPKKLKTVTITSATSIPDHAFAGCENIETIRINDGDMNIEDLAFYNCTSLKNLTLPTGTTKIGIEAFAGCVSLEEVSISKNVLEIGQYAFSGCSSLKEIRLPNGLLTIGSVAFKNCSALTSVEVPSSVTSIGGSAFSGCDDLESITLPFIGTSEGNSNRAFRRIFNSEQTDSSSQYYGKGVPEKLKTVTITNATSIPDHAFAGCNNIETIRINDGDMNIGNLAFYNCTSLKNLTLPTRTTKIGNEAFEGCASLEEVSISKNVLEIGQNAFSGCSGLKEIRLPNGLMTIGSSAFKNCSALTSVEVPSSVTSIGGNAFSGCDNLESITLPFIGTSEGSGNRAFRKIFNNAENDSYAYYYGKGVPEKLKKVTITNATSIPAYAFAGCTGIQKIVVLGTTTSIGAQAFEKCSSLQVLQLPNTILSVSSNAFAYCISLENLQLPAMLTSLPTNAFTGCTALPKATDEARDGGITSHLYNEVIANAASATGLRYTALQGTQDRYALTLIDGEQVLYSDILETGDDLTDTLSAYRPKDKEENGLHMTFYGWSLDGETYLPWRPTVMPHESLTLSAYFVPVQEATFACVLRGETIYSETVQAGVGLSVPKAEVPDMTGYVFDGWFLDDDFVTPFTSGTKMPENGLMVYGKMYPIPATMAFTKANDGMTLTRYMPATVADSSVSIPAYYNGVPVKAIAPEAFDYGSSIRVLIIPETVSSISEDALRGLTNLYSIQVHSDNKDFVSESGVLFTADKQTLLRYPASREASSYQVPEGTKTIAANAFTGAGKLKTIELADSVSVLGDYAFYDCSAITSFTANGLTKIGSSALPNGNCSFYGPVKTGVLREKLLLSEKYGVPMFTSPYNLYPLNLYQNGSLIVQYSLEAGSLIPDAFLYENDSQIYAWYKDAAMTEQWAYTEQMPQEALSLYGATEQVITYEHATFGEDESIEGIRLTAYHGRGGNIILPETLDGLDVMALGEGFLAGTHGPVQSVAIGNQVIEIASDALAGSEAYPFTGSIIADADSFVAAWAAENGYQLNARTYTLSFAVQGGAKLNDRVLAAGAEILLPVPVKEGNVFMGWYLDETLVTPTELEDGLYIMPRSAQTLYAAWEGEETVYPFTFEEAASSIVVTGISAKGEETTELVIPETINGLPVTEIAAEAFVNAKITSVSLPESMQRIGDRAFAGTPIQTAALGGTRIMGSGVFANCTELAALEMPKMETIGEGAFACCESLKVFPVPSGLVDFHPEVIKGCIGLEAFAVAADHPVYTEIDGMLVKKPMLLVSYPAGKLASSFVLPDGITMIGEEAFLGAWYLRDVTLTEDLISLGRFAFAECPELTDVTFADDSIEIIPEGCFSGSSRLNVLRLPDHLLEIGSRAFFGCDRLGTVDIADTVETIGSLAFAGDYVTLEGAYGLTAWQFAQDNDLRFIVNGGTQVTRLEIQMNTDNMHPGDIRAMTVQIEPEDAILGGEIAWYTSDAGIAFVYDHELHILSAGEVTVYAVAPNGVSAALPLDIYVAPESLSLDYTERLLLVGNSMNLKGTVLPFDTTDPTLVWMSSDPEIVQVSNTGKITANAVGVCDITASAVNGISAVCRVYVTSVAPSCATPVIYTGQRVRLELKGDVDLSGLPVSSESNYESVSTDGLLLEGVKAGEATVTISLGGYTMSVPVKVKQQPDSFALPHGLEVIEEEAFLGIPAVYVIIPQGTVSIEALAFAQMTSLEQIVIPASVTSIADNALEGSSQATLVVYPGTAGETYAQEHQMNYLLMAE